MPTHSKTGCAIRRKPATQSGGNRPPVPVDSGHLFRLKSDTMSFAGSCSTRLRSSMGSMVGWGVPDEEASEAARELTEINFQIDTEASGRPSQPLRPDRQGAHTPGATAGSGYGPAPTFSMG